MDIPPIQLNNNQIKEIARSDDNRKIALFLKEHSIINTKPLVCKRCSIDMIWRPRRCSDQFTWRCNKCATYCTIRFNSFFGQYRMALNKIMHLIFEWTVFWWPYNFFDDQINFYMTRLEKAWSSIGLGHMVVRPLVVYGTRPYYFIFSCENKNYNFTISIISYIF